MTNEKSNEDMFEEDSLQTLKREARSIGLKIKYSLLMLPGDREEAISCLKEWDLWGPLLICLLFSIGIGIKANEKYMFDDFVNVFAIFWVGSFLVSINVRLLGNKGSILQSISVIGYCLMPIAVIGMIVSALPTSTPVAVKLPLIIISLIWSVVSCLIVMKDLVSEEKKYLCAYPVLLFYIFLAWYSIIA